MKIESLHESGDAELAKELGVGQDLLDADIRQREISNWLANLATR